MSKDENNDKQKIYRRLQYLEAFQAMMDTGSVSEAARRLGTSQPTVSRMLAKLEEVSGVSLFIRSGGRLCVTSEALRVKEEVDQVLTNLERLEFLFNTLSHSMPKRLRFGTSTTLADSMLPKVLSRFSREHPDIGYYLATGTGATMNQAVLENKLDLAIIASPVAQSAVSLVPLFEADYVCVIPEGHHLAEKELLEARDFKNQKLILPPKSSPKRHEFQRLFARDKVYTTAFVETSLVNVLMEMVCETRCIGFANALMARASMREGVIIRPLDSDIKSYFSLIKSDVSELSLYQKTFVRLFCDYVRELNDDAIKIYEQNI